MKKIQLSIVVIALISLIFTSCERGFLFISGEGPIVTQTLTLAEISAINANGSFDVVIAQGTTQEVRVEGQQNIIDRLKTNVSNNTWNIELENGSFRNFDLTVYITVPQITDIELNGSGNIEIGTFENENSLNIGINGSGNIENTGTLSIENIDIEISGSGSCTLNPTSASIKSSITGSGDISLNGLATNQEISIIGSGKYIASDCVSETTDITISGSGDCYVFVNNSLNVNISGSGDVYYKGNPSVDVNISGSGQIISQN